MLKKSMSLNLLFLFTVFCALSQSHLFPVPTARQLRWAQAEFGVIFHYDLHVFDGKRYDQAINGIHPVENYNMFNTS